MNVAPGCGCSYFNLNYCLLQLLGAVNVARKIAYDRSSIPIKYFVICRFYQNLYYMDCIFCKNFNLILSDMYFEPNPDPNINSYFVICM
jgi:hypothetical protein